MRRRRANLETFAETSHQQNVTENEKQYVYVAVRIERTDRVDESETCDATTEERFRIHPREGTSMGGRRTTTRIYYSATGGTNEINLGVRQGKKRVYAVAVEGVVCLLFARLFPCSPLLVESVRFRPTRKRLRTIGQRRVSNLVERNR